MKQNMGTLDKAIRIVIALVIAALYFTNVISGTMAAVGLIVAGIFILTSFAGTCPLYLPFNFSTKKEK
jgi:hypothetical protein